MSKELPAKPSLENLKNQAKALLKAHKQGLPEANSRIREFHPIWSRSSVEQIQNADISLNDAQWVIAREYGFISWAKLKSHIDLQKHPQAPATAIDLPPRPGWISAGERHITKEYHDWVWRKIGEILQVINFAEGEERVVLQKKFDVLSQELKPTYRIREYIESDISDSKKFTM